MIFNTTPIDGAFIIDIQKHGDNRGFFGRAFCENEFRENKIPFKVAQANIACSHKKGTLRGMHYQVAPHQEAKLVRCIRGEIFDAIIDLRQDSSSYGKWFGVRLSSDSNRMLFLPEGTAHGYLSLADDTEIFYLVSQFYTPGAEQGIRWNDPAFNIDWPISENLTISEKDQAWPDFIR